MRVELNISTIRFAILLISIAFLVGPASAQERYRVMFYNVENLFDPFNDSLTRDDDFTPEGSRRWTWNRMDEKLNNIYRVIAAVGEWDPPVMVGFCEVENYFVMNRLVKETPLLKYNYRVIHRDSPDGRGIDVALIYRPDLFQVHETRFFRVQLPDSSRTTREVLYTWGILDGIDTLHVFVNHWPSKWGGALASEPARMAAARTVRTKVDSIQIFYPNARILVMGDFNDTPSSRPLTEELNALPIAQKFKPKSLYNLHYHHQALGYGTLKYQGAWEVIDMIIASGSLLNQKHPIYLQPNGGKIFKASFLMEPDENFLGERPFRTYIGHRYHGGFSDHLPVYLDLLRKNN